MCKVYWCQVLYKFGKQILMMQALLPLSLDIYFPYRQPVYITVIMVFRESLQNCSAADIQPIVTRRAATGC